MEIFFACILVSCFKMSNYPQELNVTYICELNLENNMVLQFGREGCLA